MITWLRNNKVRLITCFITIVVIFFYVKLRMPKDPDILQYGMHWLEAALIAALILSAFPFIIGVIRKEGKICCKQQFGLLLGIILYTVLLVIFVIALFTKLISFEILSFIFILTSVLVLIIDYLLGLECWVIEMDVVIFITLILTYLVRNLYPIYPVLSAQSQVIFNFLTIWHSGATAFQIILVNLLFDPWLYIKIFSNKGTNDDKK